MSDNELSTFIRTHREALTPAEVGLPTGARRRTPGLRRSELATLAGISVEYLTRIEQGRDRNPSQQILRALGDALRLSPEERGFLRYAAKSASGADSGCCAGAEPPGREVRPTVQALLDQLEPAPAVLINRLMDVLAWTSGYDLLVRPLGLLDADQPNLLRFHFEDPRARTAFPDWDHVADRRVTALRATTPPADPHLAEAISRLSFTAGDAFTVRAKAPLAPSPSNGVERLAHPAVGELRMAYETLALPAVDEQRLLVYLPADTATGAALDRLTGRQPRSLRVVTA